jgi:hypothetical protein
MELQAVLEELVQQFDYQGLPSRRQASVPSILQKRIPMGENLAEGRRALLKELPEPGPSEATRGLVTRRGR